MAQRNYTMPLPFLTARPDKQPAQEMPIDYGNVFGSIFGGIGGIGGVGQQEQQPQAQYQDPNIGAYPSPVPQMGNFGMFSGLPKPVNSLTQEDPLSTIAPTRRIGARSAGIQQPNFQMAENKPGSYGIDQETDPFSIMQAELEAYNERRKTRPLKGYEGVEKPQWTFNERMPEITRDNLRGAITPGLDASLILGGLGALIGSPGFGAQAGQALLGGATARGNQLDAQQNQYNSALYDDRLREAMNRYQRDTQLYGTETRAIDQYNDNIRSEDNAELTGINNRFEVSSKAKQEQQKARQAAINEEGRRIVALIRSGQNLSPEQQGSFGKFLNENMGTNFDPTQLLWGADPDTVARIKYMAASDAEKIRMRENELKGRVFIAQQNNDASLQRTYNHDKTLETITQWKIGADKEIAQLKQVSSANTGKLPQAAVEEMRVLRGDLDNIAKRVNNKETSSRAAANALSTARSKLTAILRNPEYIDPAQPGGLSDIGKQANAMAMDEIKIAESRYTNAVDEYTREIETYNNARKALLGTVEKYKTIPPPQPVGQNGVVPMKFGLPPSELAKMSDQEFIATLVATATRANQRAIAKGKK